MSQFVYSHADALLADGRWHVRLNRGEAWFADDPVVAAYPHFFTRYPLVAQSTVGRVVPALSLLSEPEPSLGPTEPEPVASVPVVDDAERAVDAINAMAETNPAIAAVVSADRRRTRRG